MQPQVLIQTAEEWENDADLRALAGFEVVNGDLTIESRGVLAPDLNSSSGGLSSLRGLESLREVLGNVSITSTDSLTALDGLTNLEHVGRALFITNNTALTDVALPSLAKVGDGLSAEPQEVVSIEENPLLPQAAAEALIAQVEAAGGFGAGDSGRAENNGS